MALVIVMQNRAGNTTASATLSAWPATSDIPVGSMAVLLVSADNAGTLGADAITTVTDNRGNTWTRQQSLLYDPGAANEGVSGAIFTCLVTTTLDIAGAAITINFSPNVAAKTYVLYEIQSDAGGTIDYLTGDNVGSATASPSVTTGSITSGDMLICGLFMEAGTTQTVTGDTDTTNGFWASSDEKFVGTTTTGNGIATVTKLTTGTGTQTWNPTLSLSTDCIMAYAVFHETIAVVPGLPRPPMIVSQAVQRAASW